MKDNVNTNRHIDNIIMSANWEIEPNFAMQELSKYLTDIEARQNGATFKEIGLAQRKASMMPKIITEEGAIIHQSGTASDMNNTTPMPKNAYMQINIIGTMRSESDWCNYGMREISDYMSAGVSNPQVKGILMVVNSGGGESLAGQILQNAIKDFQTRKPIVVHADFAASAALKGILTATEIIASGDNAYFGSVGTYASINKRIVEWYKENIHDIYSTVSPQKNADFRKYLEGDPILYENAVTESAKAFQEQIKKYKPKAAKNNDLLEGAVLSASLSKQIGLIDAIGTKDFALRRLNYFASNY